ncbi:MAG: glycosyltransferase [Polynucleobacter sp.]|uniref:glycosyltransferase n=1 Tax=Polynucleobacter sp. TaxID=2029855 RepID=UPI002726F8E3|nr:glycosyltransferase [Polynucleobacter sp.]MDO8714692.1 glycosyltransferase [Polynucleobacter sp.]
MSTNPIFLSVAFVVRNSTANLNEILLEATTLLSSLVSDYELIIIDNASNDDSVAKLKKFTLENGLPNLQVYALTKEVDVDTAAWVGLENALGDFVAVIDPMQDSIQYLPEMLERSLSGADVVFAANTEKAPQTLAYRCAYVTFNYLYKRFHGVHLSDDAPPYRILSKSVINFILQHPQPAMAYRHLPATGGFARENLSYSATPKKINIKKLNESIDRGAKLLVATTHGPMRLVTTLSLFGAFANVLYSFYVIAIGIFSAHVQPGWISISLQQSGMFFLISLVLLVLGEYILQMASLSNEGPLYHVGQEFTSARMTRHEKLNIEVVAAEPTAALIKN